MTRAITRALGLVGLILASLAAAGSAAASDRPPGALTACVVGDNPPFSSASAEGRGIDVDVAQLIAQQLGRELHLQWVRVPARGGIGRALKESIQSGTCDVFLGIPDAQEMATELRERHLASTRAYLAVGYLLVSPPGSKPATIREARRVKRLGASTATPADLFLYKEHFNRVPYGNNRDLLVALCNGEIDMALAWSPGIATLRADGSGAQVVIASEQPDDRSLRTGLAIATRLADSEMTRQIDLAIQRLQADGSFANLADRHGLPYMAPQ